MPFTLAHPAAVLPFKRWLWFPALAAGAMAPDVAYYLPLPIDTHALVSVVTVDVVVGALMVLVAWVAQRPFLALCGDGVRRRANGMKAPTLPILAASLVVGAATHVVWDAFTHTHGFIVQNWSLMRISVVGPHRLYNVFGYVSAIGGMLILGIVLRRWYRRTPPSEPRRPAARRKPWIFAGIGAATVAGAVIALADLVSQVSTYDWVRQLLLGSIQGAVAAFALYVLAFYVVKPKSAMWTRWK
ncbi:DUF4184 family protein [Kibdelosporangium philippinense]|uniref:DUF4184 family protein n=1 Tax=Kibdelosporangium philippinense TaxID=211113 RepID=A0ABS8Z414_9PSEU|nr:DUF4184 family protein [Kibdelosporangium philippinense]MCE7002663.1 DUF4184 family protein [Kibdelosporangium philippinense]